MSCQVSVCIPAFRQPDLAVRAVGSALEQAGCELEVVVTDDSPTIGSQRPWCNSGPTAA